MNKQHVNFKKGNKNKLFMASWFGCCGCSKSDSESHKSTTTGAVPAASSKNKQQKVIETSNKETAAVFLTVIVTAP